MESSGSLPERLIFRKAQKRLAGRIREDPEQILKTAQYDSSRKRFGGKADTTRSSSLSDTHR